MCIRTRDQAELVDAQISFHLNAGVDFVVVTDHRSEDGTLEILRAYEREGCLRLLQEPGDRVYGSEWRTRMARLAATEHGADWVIQSDGDEFWWPRGRSLKEVLEAVPASYGVVKGLWRVFVPRPGAELFAERMTVRLSPSAAINDVGSPYRPNVKVVHRAHPEVVVDRGAHAVSGDGLGPSPPWLPLEVLHFPVRSAGQFERKYRAWGTQHAGRANTKAAASFAHGTSDSLYGSLAVSDEALEQGLAAGVLTVDTRLRDALRALRRGRPGGARGYTLPSELARPLSFSPAEDTVRYAVEAACLEDADLVRLRRRVDRVETRLLDLGREGRRARYKSA